VRNPATAFRLEARRLALKHQPAMSRHNALLGWYGVSALVALAFVAALGPEGLLFFMVQSVVAAATLEVVNYIEHYGLARQRLADGRYEPVRACHSWNSSFLLSNLLLLQLPRHSDHHAHAGRRYASLRHVDDAPQLPSGYAAMFLLALVPPLWFAVMDPRIDTFFAAEPAGAA
jgi:alkane 1-monooxygenase